MMAKEPVRFSQELFDTICQRIADGESLRSISLDHDMPTSGTVIRWLAEDSDGKLQTQYARAREAQADAIADETLHIADTEKDTQVARVRIDTRKWYAGKVRPKKYGDRVVNQMVGADDGPIQYQNLTEEELQAQIAELRARAQDGGGE